MMKLWVSGKTSGQNCNSHPEMSCYRGARLNHRIKKYATVKCLFLSLIMSNTHVTSSNIDYIKASFQWRHLSQPLGDLTFPSSYSTTTSLRLLSPCYVMCDMPKPSVLNWRRYYFIIRKTLQTVTVTVVVNDCTKISIFDMSSVEPKKSAFCN